MDPIRASRENKSRQEGIRSSEDVNLETRLGQRTDELPFFHRDKLTEDTDPRNGSQSYREFIQDRDRLERIDAFLRVSRYWERVAAFGNPHRYCEAQYRAIDALCRVNRQYLSSLLPPAPETDEKLETNRAEDPPKVYAGAGVLPIVLDPSPETTFRKALLRQRHAWIVEVHRDGRRAVRRWNAANMSASSGIIGNPRSRPRYRKGTWEQLGLKSLIVSIRQPGTT